MRIHRSVKKMNDNTVFMSSLEKKRRKEKNALSSITIDGTLFRPRTLEQFTIDHDHEPLVFSRLTPIAVNVPYEWFSDMK